MLSYWEKENFIDAPDVCIVGSGIVGLTTALYIKKKKPHYEVVICERGFLPDGASTKNAGFCCFGSVSELTDDMEKWPKEDVLALAEKRFKGLLLLKDLIKDENMAYEQLGGYEVFTQKTDFEFCLEKAHFFNREFEKSIGKLVYTDASADIEPFGFANVSGMIKNNFEGQINTGLMVKTLLNLAQANGIRVFFGLDITGFEQHNARVLVHTKNDVDFYCNHFLVTTNGFARQLLPQLDVRPARAQVLITNPIENLAFKGSFHYDKGYYYFRNVGNRILLGGGRNLDFVNEETFAKGLTPVIQDALFDLLEKTILPHNTFSIDMRWSGTMGIGNEKKTIVTQISQNVFCGVRMGGMGVALGSLVGKELSEMVA